MKYLKYFESSKGYQPISKEDKEVYFDEQMYIKFEDNDFETIKREFDKMGYNFYEGGPWAHRSIFSDVSNVTRRIKGGYYEAYYTNDWCISNRENDDYIQYVGQDLDNNNLRLTIYKINDEYFILSIRYEEPILDENNLYFKCDQLWGLLDCLKDYKIIKNNNSSWS
jgi:hypothetical protein